MAPVTNHESNNLEYLSRSLDYRPGPSHWHTVLKLPAMLRRLGARIAKDLEVNEDSVISNPIPSLTSTLTLTLALTLTLTLHTPRCREAGSEQTARRTLTWR